MLFRGAPSLLTYLVLLLSLFHVSVSSAIISRQSNTIDCTDYSRIANLTTVSNNSTYRAAFLRSAPMGTFKAASILDQDALKLPALQLDSQLNGQCGNLTSIAIQAAATNFTQGDVLGFKILTDVGVAPDAIAMLLIWAFVTVMIGGMCISL
jgi:hypothetical protein